MERVSGLGRAGGSALVLGVAVVFVAAAAMLGARSRVTPSTSFVAARSTATASPTGTVVVAVAPELTLRPSPTLPPTASPSPTPRPSPEPISVVGFTTPGSADSSKWDGLSWSAVAPSSPLPSVDRIVHWRGGWVAYTCGCTDAPDGVQKVHAAYWSSSDGVRWSPVSALDIGLPAANIVEAPGGLVAIESYWGSDLATGPHVWVSADGAAWRSVGIPADLAGLSIDTVAGTANAIVALAYDAAGNRVISSSDGMNWRDVIVPGGPFCWCDTASSPVWVQSAGGRVFLEGVRQSAAGVDSVGIYWSNDGRSWTSVKGAFRGLPGMLTARDAILAVSGDGLNAWDAEVWSVSTDGGSSWRKLANYGPLSKACQSGFGCGSDGAIYSTGDHLLAVNEAGQAWISTDATNWSRFDLGGRTFKTEPNGANEAYDLKLLPTGVYVNGWFGSAR